MPVSGFHKGDRVQTPAGRYAVVVRTSKRSGREIVAVKHEGSGRRLEIAAGSLRLVNRRDKEV